MGNKPQIDTLFHSLISKKDGVIKTIKAVNKKTGEEVSSKELLSLLVKKTEDLLSKDGNMKNIFSTLIDIFSMDFITRILNPENSEYMALLSSKNVREDIIKFGLISLLVYPYLIENNLELKVEERALTEIELDAINKMEKIVYMISFFGAYGVSSTQVATILLKKLLINEDELKMIGLREQDIKKIRDQELPDEEVINAVVYTFTNFESMKDKTSLPQKLKKVDISELN